MEILVTIIGSVLVSVLVCCLVALIGTEVIYRIHTNLLDAMLVHACHNEPVDFIDPYLIRDWDLIDCFCPWRWRYKYWLPEEEFEKIAPYLRRGK